jgi:bifunctional DNA-binding transcriptional regulator/antitoxin component of YhaV-PrlF toxin-antitoxin module
VLRPKRQATIPRRPCDEAGLHPGDRLRVRAEGSGRVVLERIEQAEEPAA